MFWEHKGQVNGWMATEDVGRKQRTWGAGGGWRMYGDEGKRVDGILKQVDERREQKIGWEIKETGRGHLGMERI